MKRMTLSIIIVNWNSSAFLLECIASINRWNPDVERELIVVDNASPDDHVDILKEEFKDINLIKSAENLGFARANNLGFKQCTGEHLLFLNPDTQLTGPAIRVMLGRLESLENAGVVGCRLLNSDLSVQTACIQKFPTVLNQALDADVLRKRWPNSRLWGIAPLFESDTRPAAVEVISGACMMMRREVFEGIGLFSEDYFMYAEDVDLCRKAVRAGYNNYYIGDATIIHHGGKSSSPQTATVAKWHSMLQYLVKNHGYGYALLFRGVMSLVALGRLGLIAMGSFRQYNNQNSKAGYSPLLKWRTILKTLLTHSGTKSVPSHG